MSTPSLRVNGIKFPDGSNSFSAVFNAKDPAYGAVGNGIVDDTAACQAAIDACVSAGGIMYFPPGTYKITSTLNFADKLGVQFLGGGMRSTIFKWAGAVGGVLLNINGVRESNIGEFTLLGDVANPTTTALKYNGDLANTFVSTSNRFSRIFIQNYCAYGIRIGQTAYQCDQSKYEQLQIYNCSTAGVSIEDANAVAHNFYDTQFNGCAVGISSSLAGTGGSFNLAACVFKSCTVCDIQTYPGSRGYDFSGVMSETGAVFLQMPQASTNTTVSLTDCSVNGSTSVGPHIRMGAGTLNINGGKYTATPNTFTVSMGNINGNVGNILVKGPIFPDGNPFTGSNITLYGAIRREGVKYAGVAGDQGDIYGAGRSSLDTAGGDTLYTSASAGAVSAAGGKVPGNITVQPAAGVAGTAGLAAGNGANLFLRSSAAGTNNGGGAGSAGNVYLYPDVGGVIFIADSGGVTRGTISPGGTSWFFPADDLLRKLGASANRFLAFFVRLITQEVGTAIASATTIAPSRAIHHITGTTTIQTITPPADYATTGNGGRLTLWFDGVAPWSAAGNIIVAGTPTTIGTFVDFVWDQTAGKWSPSRTA